MPKKASRSARALQAQRGSLAGGERKMAARPLIIPENSRLNVATTEVGANGRRGVYETPTATATETEVERSGIYDAPAVEETTDAIESLPLSAALARPRATPARTITNGSGSVAATGTVNRPASASRRPVARRSTTVTRQPEISREEEYAYIRSDLLTVFLLTVLMIIVLIVLTFVLGR